jgi:hypothetical protein
MDIHVRRLSALNIGFGAIALLISVALLLFYGGPIGIYESTEDNIMGLIMSVAAVVNFVLSIPCIIGGIFLRQLKEWSRGMMIVTSALNIMNVPVGSILGGYGLWVLLTPETDPLFTPQPMHRITNKGVAQHKPSAEEAQAAKNATTASTIVPSPRS